MMRVLFVVNPKSGKGNIKNSLLAVLDTLTQADCVTTVHVTQAPKDATEVVKEIGGNFDIILCSGGDGTLDEVVAGVMTLNKKIPIGYIPAGSTNDFAKSLGISSDNIEAVKMILEGHPFLCDAGLFNDSYFTYVAAFGALTEVSYSTPQQTKNMLGHLAYILEGAKSLASIQSYQVKVEYIDNETGQLAVIDDDIIFGMITNAISVGGMKRYKEEEVSFDDGLFEVVLIKRPKNMLELNAILGSLLLNDFNREYMYFLKTESIKVSCEKEVSWTLDGEFGGSVKEAEIHNINKGFAIYRKFELQANS